MAGIFKAYDVRGIYPDQLDERTALEIGRAFPRLLNGDRSNPKVVIGRDMREHSQRLSEALADGLAGSGCEVCDIGLATTPMSYFAVGHLGAAGGVQVTASHNPAQYNGFKFSLSEARPVSGNDGIPRLERLVAEGNAVAADGGSRREVPIFEDYGRHVLGQLERPQDAATLRVVADAANGMGTLYRPLLERAGIDLLPLYFELDGSFPNHEANPLKPENLEDVCAAVRDSGADFGVAFDGDADRAVFVDETGEPIGADLTTALIAGRKLARSPGGAVVYDIRSSRAVPEYIVQHGGTPIRERVGHSFIKATLRAHDGVFGGELAGHYYFRENYFADSSLLAVFEVLNLLWQERRPLSAIVAPLRRYAKSPEINFEIEDKAAAMAGLTERYGGAGEVDDQDGIRIDFEDWWFNVRPSNTEPLLRLVLEATTPELLDQHSKELIAFLGTPV